MCERHLDKPSLEEVTTTEERWGGEGGEEKGFSVRKGFRWDGNRGSREPFKELACRGRAGVDQLQDTPNIGFARVVVGGRGGGPADGELGWSLVSPTPPRAKTGMCYGTVC